MGNKQIDSREGLVQNRLLQVSDHVTLTYADGATAVASATRRLICWVPAKSLITNVYVRKVTDFNAAGNDYITVGTEDDDDLLLNDLDVSSAAATLPYNASKSASLVPYYTDTAIAVYATYVYSSTAPTTGEAEVAIEWVPWTECPVDKTL